MPAILYGTAWKTADTARLVELAIRCGFRGIDTACQPKHYDEAGVGRGVAACLGSGLSRADLYLQTKFTPPSGQDPARLPYDAHAAPQEQVAQSAAASLTHLGTDYLDCLILHSPLPTAAQTLTVWRAFESLVAVGRVRRLGVSNCYALKDFRTLHRQARIKPTVLQNRFHADTGYDRPLRAFCRQNGVVYQSFWTLTANPERLAHPVVAQLAARHARTAPQILFRYLSESGAVPLTGTRSEAHMREDLAIADFRLTAAECRELDGVFTDLPAKAPGS